MFSRKKSSKGEKKKSSIGALIESSGSLLNPEVQKTIIDGGDMDQEEEEGDEFRISSSPSPYIEWRMHRERSDLDQTSVSHVSQTYIHHSTLFFILPNKSYMDYDML